MDDCLFCKIIMGDIPSNKVYEDEKVLAFHDIDKKAPVHVLIIPKNTSSLSPVSKKKIWTFMYTSCVSRKSLRRILTLRTASGS